MIPRLMLVAVFAVSGFVSEGQQPVQPGALPQPAPETAKGAATNLAQAAPGQSSRPAVIPQLLFEGGSVDMLIERMKQAGRSANPPLPPLNVIIPAALQGEIFPQFELHNVPYADVFLALNKMNAESKQAVWELSGPGSSGEQIWVLN